MQINDLLAAETMILNLAATDKIGAFKEMIAGLKQANRISSEADFLEGILAREAQTSTGLGDGIGIPHAKNAAVLQPDRKSVV